MCVSQYTYAIARSNFYYHLKTEEKNIFDLKLLTKILLY